MDYILTYMPQFKKIPTLVYSRVVGYFQPVSQWNIGKKAEYKNRKQYSEEEILKSMEVKND